MDMRVWPFVSNCITKYSAAIRLVDRTSKIWPTCPAGLTGHPGLICGIDCQGIRKVFAIAAKSLSKQPLSRRTQLRYKDILTSKPHKRKKKLHQSVVADAADQPSLKRMLPY